MNKKNMIAKCIICFLLTGVLLLSLVGCAGRETRTDLENIAYGEDEQQAFDLFLPAGKEKELPLIVLIHGGKWITGDKSTYSPKAIEFCEQYGVAAASIGYRYLSENTTMEDLMDDIGASVEAICTTAAENGVNISRVAFRGHSSGGHLALLYAYTCTDTCPVPVAFVAASSSPTDLTDDNYFAPDNIMGKSNIERLFSWGIGETYTYETRKDFVPLLQTCSPLFLVNENTVPTLLQHSNHDSLVPYSNAVALDAKLTECGVEHAFITYSISNHGLEDDPDCTAQADTLFAQYVNKYLFEN